MPSFPLSKFLPEVTESIPREPSFGSSEGAAARGSQIHAGAGGIVPVSQAPATFGLGTAPVRENPIMRHLYEGETFTLVNIAGAGGYYVRSRKTTTDLLKGTTQLYTPPTVQLYKYDPKSKLYRETGLWARSDGPGKWAFNDTPATHSTSAASQPGPSRAASPQAMPWAKDNVLEIVLSMAENHAVDKNFSFRKKREWLFHTFDGEKLPRSKGPDTLTPAHDRENRADAFERVKTLLEARGYKVAPYDKTRYLLHLDVTNPEHTDAAHPDMPKEFSVYIRLSSGGTVTPPTEAPMNQPYLLAVVAFDAQDGMLETVHLIPIKHEQRQHAAPPEPSVEASRG
jgi:hypothetical protein